MNLMHISDVYAQRLQEIEKKLEQKPHMSQKDFLNSMNKPVNSGGDDKCFTWEGTVVAVVGLFDKGKTFTLNAITNSNLPSGKKVSTLGLSFKHVDFEEGTKLILLDTAGSYSPVKVENEFSVVEKEATEHFQLDLVFDLSD